ncbi:MAG: ParA family protein [Planctomycetota bacterium]
MARILSVVNQKGGVGKTTTAVNLSAALATAGQRTLLIDLDPQCNATAAVGGTTSARHGVLSDQPIDQSVWQTATENLMLLPGSRHFRDAAELDGGDADATKRLRSQIDSIQSTYDFILFDCPPSAGAMTETAMTASTEVVIPIQCEYFAMVGVTQLIGTIKKVISSTSGRLTFGGIVMTMVDESLELTREVDEEVRDFFGDIVFDNVVPRDVALCEAPSHGQTVFQYAPRSRGAYAYIQLCMEVLQRD